jgi:hypothetical protein
MHGMATAMHAEENGYWYLDTAATYDGFGRNI